MATLTKKATKPAVKDKAPKQLPEKDKEQKDTITRESLIVEDAATRRRYHIDFRDGYKGPSSENLFGLLKEPFAGKTEYLDRLVEAGDSIGLTMSYSEGPFKEVPYRAMPRCD